MGDRRSAPCHKGRHIDDMYALLAAYQRLRRTAGERRVAAAQQFYKRFRQAAGGSGVECFAVVELQCATFDPHRLCALSRIASNTGARSPGDELMTPNTSAVAVCCSSASRVSVKRRAFSIAMTACAAKFCNSAICLSENGRISVRYTVKAPSSALSLRKAMQAKLRAAPNSTSARAGRAPARWCGYLRRSVAR